MENINPNISSLVQMSKAGGITNFNSVLNNVKAEKEVMPNDAAFNVIPNMSIGYEDFDSMMGNIWSLKNVVNTAQGGIASMIQQGESIRTLIQKAREENLSPESLDAIENEVQARLEQINNIRQNTFFNDINPFEGAISLNIPNFQEIFGDFFANKSEAASEAEENEEENFTEIASFQFDMTIDGKSNGTGFNLGASATVKIGYTDDGSLQITVDATMDFDLSKLKDQDIKSDDTFEMINNFLAMLTGKNNALGQASNMLESLFASGSASIVGDNFAIDATNDINITNDSSKYIQGQIVQHAKITLDSTANQSPSIAINLL